RGDLKAAGQTAFRRPLVVTLKYTMQPKCGPFTFATFSVLCSLFNPAFAAQIWTQTSAPNTNWVSVACSADGTKIVAAAGVLPLLGNGVGPIYTSTNSGATWAQTSAPITNWAATASSVDGTRLVAAVGCAGPIYISTNAGTTWTPTGAP